jgi:hypothetical protein
VERSAQLHQYARQEGRAIPATCGISTTKATAAGTDGLGIGGGVYNLGTFLADAATVIRHNRASTSDDDLFP